MAATYDTEGNYIYPEGFDPETGEWLEGYDKQRETWEHQYAEARQRWEAHTKQVQTSRAADAEAAAAPATASTGGGGGGGGATSSTTSSPAPTRAAEEPSGTLATDEALAALREKLAGGK
jgi:small subunit ribosomal protein S1